MKNTRILDGFWLRIIAIITMIIDHLAILLVSFDLLSASSILYFIMRIFGRISFPLYALGIVEGVLNTKNLKKYLLRLGFMAISMGLAIVIIDKLIVFHLTFVENIFLTLFLGATAISFLNSKKQWIKLISFVPLLLSFFGNFTVLSPYFNPQYGIYGVLMIILMYLGNKLAHSYSVKQAKKYSISFLDYSTTSYYQKNINFGYAIAILLLNVLYYLILELMPSLTNFFLLSLQDYSIISIFIVILYNGKRGYDSKWFRTFNYMFYPMHLLILYLILYIL